MRCVCGEKFPRSAYNFCPDCGRKVGSRNVNTGGGAYIEGSISVGGGDFVGGDKIGGDKVVIGDSDGDDLVLGDVVGGKVVIVVRE